MFLERLSQNFSNRFGFKRNKKPLYDFSWATALNLEPCYWIDPLVNSSHICSVFIFVIKKSLNFFKAQKNCIIIFLYIFKLDHSASPHKVFTSTKTESPCKNILYTNHCTGFWNAFENPLPNWLRLLCTISQDEVLAMTFKQFYYGTQMSYEGPFVS